MLSEDIKVARKLQKITQELMSSRTGISRERLINFERRQGKLSEDELEKILRELGLKIILLKVNHEL